MKKKKKAIIPRSMLKNLAEDIKKMIDNNEGRLMALDLVEEIAYDMRAEVLEGLSTFYCSEMVTFFNLLKQEYGKELASICDRALTKYSLAGFDTRAIPAFNGDFYKAYASCSRHTGRLKLDVAWKNKDQGLLVESFLLTFGVEGIHDFLLIDKLSPVQFEIERSLQPLMVEISLEECRVLVSDAYSYNTRFMSRPAVGKFLYQKYLDPELPGNLQLMRAVTQKLSARLTPRQLVNSFFNAIRFQDESYLAAILSVKPSAQVPHANPLNQVLNPGALFLEGQVEGVRGLGEGVEVSAYSVTFQGHEVYRNQYLFFLSRDKAGNWLISNIENLDFQKLEYDSELNPLSMEFFCRVYEIVDVDALFDLLDSIDNIREVEELPYGIHLRISEFEDDFNRGVSFMGEIIADLVVNGEEFVLMAREKESLEDFDRLFMEDPGAMLMPQGEHRINLSSALNYLSGQYICFEDILLDEPNNFAFEDGMSLVTARYVVKDREAIINRLSEVHCLNIDLPGDYQIHYQVENTWDEHPAFLAEYILGPNWLRVSALGDRDLGMIREQFEAGLFGSLEFDGLEVRGEGIFEILTREVKKQYPQLESALKEMYLNKWSHSHLPNLSGMTPFEASQSVEGTRLLWSMFKRIKQKEKRWRWQGKNQPLGLKEYIRKLDMEFDIKKQKKH